MHWRVIFGPLGFDFSPLRVNFGLLGLNFDIYESLQFSESRF